MAVFAVLPFAFLLAPLPKAVLGMAIVSAILSLLNPAPLLELWRRSRMQAGIGLTTFAMTLLFAPRVEIAVVAGIALAVAVHLWREGGQQMETTFHKGELTVRPMGVMWFGSAPGFRRSLGRHLTESEEIRRIVVDLSGLGRLDLSGAYVLKASLDAARHRGVSAAVANIPPQLRRIVASVCPDIEIVETRDSGRAQRNVQDPAPMESHMPISANELIAKAKAQIKTCDAKEAAAQIRRRANLLLIDVREPNEHNLGVIENAELVPRGILESKICEPLLLAGAGHHDLLRRWQPCRPRDKDSGRHGLSEHHLYRLCVHGARRRGRGRKIERQSASSTRSSTT